MIPAGSESSTRPELAGRNPFPGIRPFQEEDAALFFGRDEEVGELLSLLSSRRFLAVLGVSGCGKSSLVRAGMIPALRIGMAEGLVKRWRIVTICPRRSPLANLRQGLEGEFSSLSLPHQWPLDSFALVDLAESTLTPEEALLVVVDQFEELFGFWDESFKLDGGNEAALFVNLLLRATEQRRHPVYVALSMRSDYLGKAAQFRGLPEAMNHGHYLVPRMTRAKQEEAIEGPLASAGGAMHVALVQHVLNDAADQPDNLPVLQHLLKRLWEEWTSSQRTTDRVIDSDDYNAVGGWAEAIDADAEPVFGSFQRPEEQAGIERMFRWITDRGRGDEPVRRPARFSELTAVTRLSSERLRKIIKAFQNRGLLRNADLDGGSDPLIDLPHECIERRWRRLKKWIDQEAEDASRVRFFGEAAASKNPLTGSALVEARRLRRRVIEMPQWRDRYLPDPECAKAVLDWIDRSQLRQRRRTAAIAAMAVLVLSSTAVAGRYWYENIESEHEVAVQKTKAKTEASARAALSALIDGGLLRQVNAEKNSEKRRALATGSFDFLAGHYLWPTQCQGQHTFSELRLVLEDNQPLLPPEYGIRTPGQAPSSPGGTKMPPIEISYSKGELNERLFDFEWSALAPGVVEEWGVPFPTSVTFSTAAGLKRSQIRIRATGRGSSAGRADLLVQTDSNTDRAVLVLPRDWQNKAPEEPATKFYRQFAPEGIWRDVTPATLVKKQSWLLVPRWSLPVWKVGLPPVLQKLGDNQTTGGEGGYLATGSDGYRVYECLERLLANPDIAFSEGAVRFLLDRARKNFPDTVAEAERSRGGIASVASALTAIVKTKRDILYLPIVLDFLASDWEEDDNHLAATWDGIQRGNGSYPVGTRLNGPWRGDRQVAAKAKAANEYDYDYRDVEPHLPKYDPVRVYVGEELQKKWFSGEIGLSSDVIDTVSDLRTRVYARYGVDLPGVRFYRGEADLNPRAIRLELLDDRPGPRSQPQVLSARTARDDLASALETQVIPSREFWVTAETISALLDELPPGVRDWLHGNYSITDLKNLMRSVVMEPGVSIRYQPWLVQSLVFWSQLGDPKYMAQLADRLRETATSLESPRGGPSRPGVDISQGIDALLSDRPDEAATAFREAAVRDRWGTIEAFFTAWPQHLPAALLASKDPANMTRPLSARDKADLIDMWNATCGKNPTMHFASRDVQLLRLFFLVGDLARQQELLLPSDMDPDGRMTRELLTAPGIADDLSPQQASWLGVHFLRSYNPLEPEPANVAAASRLLQPAIGKLSATDARTVFRQVLECVQKSPGANWASDMLNALAYARHDQAGADLMVALAAEYVNYDKRDRQLSAQELLRDAARINGSSEYANLLTVTSLRHLAQEGDQAAWDQAERFASDLARSASRQDARNGYFSLCTLLHERGRHNEADRTCRAAMDRWPEDIGLKDIELQAELQRGRAAGITSLLSADWIQKGDAGMLLPALAAILTGAPNANRITAALLKRGVEYADYIRIVQRAYAEPRFSGEVQESLENRWKEIKPAAWKPRLRNGDLSAWREIVLGRFMGKKPELETVEVLANEDLWKVSDFACLPASRRALLCEALFYEAMRAKLQGDTARMRAYLQRCIEVGYTSYVEDSMARFILARGAEPGTAIASASGSVRPR